MAHRPVEPRPSPTSMAMLGTFKYPAHNAECQRLRTIAKLFNAVGAQVCIGAANATPGRQPVQVQSGDIPVFHLSEHPPAEAAAPIKLWRHLFGGRRAVAWLRNANPPPASVFLFSGSASYAWHLLRHARKTGLPLIFDVVEWFQPSHLPGGALGPFRWNTELALSVVFPKARNIIVISRYLQRHFEAKGCRVLYLPAILDVQAVEPDLALRSAGGPLQLAYTGTPWKKDLLDPLIEAMLRLDPEGSRIQFTLAGPSEAYLLELPALKTRGLTCLPPGIRSLGYVSHEEATALVRKADYSVLLRHQDQRYAMAGFPTKVPESLAMGTPLIGNLSSDLGDFLVDGQEAFVCRQATPEACRIALERALAMSPEGHAAMRQASRALAERAFDYRPYIPAVQAFISALALP